MNTLPPVRTEAALVATLENELVRWPMVAKAALRPEANSDGLDAETNAPWPFTAACSRSSMRSASSVSVGFAQAGLAGTSATLFQPFLPDRPIEMPKVTMCCQNPGSLVVVGTLLTIWVSVRRSRFQ